MNLIEEFPNNGLVSLPRLLAFNPNPRQNKVREILKPIIADAAAIYDAGIVVLQTPEFPAKQSIVAHCFRELINAIIRIKETKWKKSWEGELAKILRLIANQNGVDSDSPRIGEATTRILNTSWKDVKNLINDEHAKLKKLYLDNPKKQLDVIQKEKNCDQWGNRINQMIGNVMAAKKKLMH